MDRQGLNPFVKFPVASLLATGAVLLPLWLLPAEFQVGTDPVEFLEGDAQKRAVYEEAERYLPAGEVMLVINLRADDVFTAETLTLMREVGESFLERPDVSAVKSFTHSYLPVRDGLTVDFRPFVPEGELTGEDLEWLREFSLSHPLVRNVMVSHDGRDALISVDFVRDFPDLESRREFREEVRSILEPFQSEAVEFQILALPLVREELETTLRRDLAVFIPLAGGVLLVVLRIAFPSWRLLLFILLNTALYMSLLPGLFQLTGLRFGTFSVILFPLLGGVHLTLLAHLCSAYQRALREAGDGPGAVAAAGSAILKSCMFACLTTAVGLLALSISDTEQLTAFGILGAAGVAAAFLLTFGPGMALLNILGPRAGSERGSTAKRLADAGGWQQRQCARLARWVTRRKRVLLAGGALLFGGALPGVFLLQTDIRVTELLDPHGETREIAERLDSAYGGVNLLRVELDSGRSGGIDSPEFLQYVWDVQRYAEDRDPVSGAYSYALLHALLNQIWEGGDADALRVPESRARIQLFAGAMHARSDVFPLLAAMNDEDRRTAHLLVRTPDMYSGRYLDLIGNIVEYAQTHRPEGVEVSAAEGIHTFLESERKIVRAQLRSAWFAFAAIGAILLVLWRCLGLALAGLLTAAFPVVFALGLAGYLGIALNSVTLMMAAIVLGVTVDDAVHFISHWRDARRGNPGAAVEDVFRVKGPPIICTTIILIAIFCLFAIASFPPIVQFGFMAAVAFVVTLGSVLLCLPSLLSDRTSRPGDSAGISE